MPRLGYEGEAFHMHSALLSRERNLIKFRKTIIFLGVPVQRPWQVLVRNSSSTRKRRSNSFMDSYEFIEFCVCPVEQKSRLSSIQEIS